MVPKKIESSNNVDLSCVNVESAEPFQLDIRKVTNQTDSSGFEQRESEGLDTAIKQASTIRGGKQACFSRIYNGAGDSKQT